MHARLLATFCLLFVSVSTLRPESLAPAPASVSVYLKTNRTTSTAVLDEMKTELASLMQGVHLDWPVLKSSQADTTPGSAVVVELRGQCSVPWHGDAAKALKDGAPLASSATADGYVLSFSWVNCDTLSSLLAPSLTDQPGARRDFTYGRAVARLLAHELYHVLLQTTGHAESGIAKTQLTAAELLAERFPFEGSAFKPPAPKVLLPRSAESARVPVDLEESAGGK